VIKCINDAKPDLLKSGISQTCVRERRKRFSLSCHPRAVAGRSEEREDKDGTWKKREKSEKIKEK